MLLLNRFEIKISNQMHNFKITSIILGILGHSFNSKLIKQKNYAII